MKDLPSACDRIVRFGLVALIAFTPLAFGTVEAWAIAAMEWGIVTLVLIFALGRLWPGRGDGLGRWQPTGLEIPIALFIGLCALQTIPLPPSWLKAISPGSARMYERVGLRETLEAERPGASEAGKDDPLLSPAYPEWRPVSVQPRVTWSRIRLLACFAALFLLVAQWGRQQRRILFLVTSVVVVGFLVAVEGLVQFLTWNGKIYWVRKVPPSSPFGPFVNHNHFAGYVEMVIPLAIGLAFVMVEGRRRERLRERGSGWGKGGLALFASVILVATLFFSLSRGGMISAVASGFLLFAFLWGKIGSARLKWSIALALPVLAASVIVWVGADVVRTQIGTYAKLESEASFQTRILIWRRMVGQLPDFAWVGAGLGAFEESFAPFVPPGSNKRWDRAHNDYLQILWETGVIGATAIAIGAALYLRRYWWPALRGRGDPPAILRVAMAVALTSIALHSLVDFNLQIGANGFLFSLLAGLLVAVPRVRAADDTGAPSRPGTIHGIADTSPGKASPRRSGSLRALAR